MKAACSAARLHPATVYLAEPEGIAGACIRVSYHMHARMHAGEPTCSQAREEERRFNAPAVFFRTRCEQLVAPAASCVGCMKAKLIHTTVKRVISRRGSSTRHMLFAHIGCRVEQKRCTFVRGTVGSRRAICEENNVTRRSVFKH